MPEHCQYVVRGSGATQIFETKDGGRCQEERRRDIVGDGAYLQDPTVLDGRVPLERFGSV
jgi:hypothetical protein